MQTLIHKQVIYAKHSVYNTTIYCLGGAEMVELCGVLEQQGFTTDSYGEFTNGRIVCYLQECEDQAELERMIKENKLMEAKEFAALTDEEVEDKAKANV